jgi:predicted  nucleic acid-binding Zn-ribbon protein
MNKIAIYGALIMSALFFAGWQQYSIKSLQSEVDLLQTNYDQLLDERDTLAVALVGSEDSKKRLSDEMRQMDRVLAEREAKLLSSKQELAGLSEELRGLRKTNAEYKMWSDAHVPDAAIRLLHNTRNAGDSED